MTRRIPVGVFFALFTISGFAGLIYQSIWSQYLKLFLGHAAYAQTLVLAIFMGGMAIGSWLVARFTARIPDLLLGYALAELGIGLLALAFHPIFLGATAWAFDTVLPALGGHATDAFKWALGSLLILPASILLGTTFPLMSGGVLRAYPETSGRALAMLYFTNSFGAAIGVLASGFYLIDRFGLPGTVMTAGMMNVALALGVWLIVRTMPATGAAPAPATAPGEGTRREFARAILVLAFATGAASFVYEVTWIRMLTLGLGASTDAFEVMLAAFIIGMALGAYWFRNRIATIRNDVAWLAGLLVAKAAFAAYAVWIYGDVLGFIGWMMSSLARSDGGYVIYTAAGLLASIVVMFPTAFCAGMTLPLATQSLTSRGYGEASIGRVYAANTAGCILGAVFATHVGMELLGVKGLTGVGALLDIAMAFLVLAAVSVSARPRRLAGVLAAACAAAAVVFYMAPLDLLRMASGVYRTGSFYSPRETKILFYRDGKTATIAVAKTGALQSIKTNGKPDASLIMDPALPASPDEATMVLAGALPLAIKPGAREIANIGLGSGLTTHTLLGSPHVERLDTIEIERMMVEGAHLFEPRNSRAYSDPRSRIHIEDAKTFFASEGRRYDIITSEPSNPWVSGVSTLFSREFYAHVKRYLKPDGLLVQWIQAYEIDLNLLATVFKALGSEFGDYTVYHNGRDLLIVATPAAKLPPLTGEPYDFPQLKADLRYLGYRDLGDLQAQRIGGRRVLAPIFALTPYAANSDYFPVLDQKAPRVRFRHVDVERLTVLRQALAPVLPLLDVDTRTSLDRLQNWDVLNRPRPVNDALAGAEAIGVVLGADAERTRHLGAEQRTAAIVVRSLLGNCRGSETDWMAALTEVARSSVPHLRAADVEPLFRAVRASPCLRSLDEVDRARFALLEAINARDAAAIATHATFLLDHPTEGLEDERGYYLASAVAALLAKGDVAQAAAVRDRGLATLVREQDKDDLVLALALGNLRVAQAQASSAGMAGR
jgi:predicted membrane-bound spermidine synthase